MHYPIVHFDDEIENLERVAAAFKSHVTAAALRNEIDAQLRNTPMSGDAAALDLTRILTEETRLLSLKSYTEFDTYLNRLAGDKKRPFLAVVDLHAPTPTSQDETPEAGRHFVQRLIDIGVPPAHVVCFSCGASGEDLEFFREKGIEFRAKGTAAEEDVTINLVRRILARDIIENYLSPVLYVSMLENRFEWRGVSLGLERRGVLRELLFSLLMRGVVKSDDSNASFEAFKASFKNLRNVFKKVLPEADFSIFDSQVLSWKKTSYGRDEAIITFDIEAFKSAFGLMPICIDKEGQRCDVGQMVESVAC